MANRAILYGVNEYKRADVPNLRGCVNDVNNIDNLLIEEYGFRSSNVRVRTDDEVLLSTIEKDWKWLTKNAQPGDKLVFHFSGHGSHVEDLNADESDGVDEILCLYDMDFHDPGTYLIDDQIHQWTKKVPSGVKLTFILDCCHSGTGTRTLDPGMRVGAGGFQQQARVVKEATKKRRNLAEVKKAARHMASRSVQESGGGEDLADPGIVLARYLVPPSNVYGRAQRAGTRSALGSASDDSNHVRFSGCKDSQTSADAFIAGKFQGAFTAEFCQTIANHGYRVTHVDLIEHVRDALEQAGFSQTPQLNPPDTRTAVFDGTDYTQPSKHEEPDCHSPSRRESLHLERLVDKMDELIDVLRVREGMQRPMGHQGSRSERATNGHSIVYVHGICWHDQDFSRDWFDAMQRHLSTDVANELRQNRHEVLWSKHVSSERDLQQQLSDEESELSEALQDVLQDRAAQAVVSQMHSGQSRGAADSFGSRHVERALLGIPGLDCVDDFVKYLLFRGTRRKVIAEFTDVVVPLLNRGHRVEIVAHSWGTVVALEGLHHLSNRGYSGFVSNLFTVGSALSIRPVQRRLKHGAESGDKPGVVDRWCNLDAQGDIVGGSLRGFPFDVDAEFLNLPPVGCDEGTLGISPACAHSSYFYDDNQRVNRDIFARWIE